MTAELRPLSRNHFDQLWKAQDGQCALCGKAMPRVRFDVAHASIWKKQRPTFDHIIPKAGGGPDRLDNLQLAHAICNKRKGKRQAGGSDGRVAT